MKYSGSYALLLALHLLAVVIIVGPLGYLTATSGRLARNDDRAGLASAAKTVRIYSMASVVAVVFGMSLLGRDAPHWTFAQAWVGAALTLWVVAMVLNFALVVPTLSKAGASAEPAASFAGKLGAFGGISTLCWVVIVVLMVYKPGA